MSITVEDFPDLIQIINTHPEWRRRLRKVLFPDIDLSKSLQELQRSLRELAEEQKLTQQALRGLSGRVDGIDTRLDGVDTRLDGVDTRMEQGFDEAAKERQHITARLDEAAKDRQRIEARMNKGFETVKRDIGDLKGESYEGRIQDKAAGIFGAYIRRGKDVRGSVSEQLYRAFEAGVISEDEIEQVLAADMLWGGKARSTGRKVVLVIEASWYAEENDLQRAANRAAILASIDVDALPVVASKDWGACILDLALERRVVTVRDKRVDRTSWQRAGERVTEQQD